MSWLWFLLIPVWIFLWVSLAVGFWKAVDRWVYSWWVLPAWMALFVPAMLTMVLGLVTLGALGAGATPPWLA